MGNLRHQQTHQTTTKLASSAKNHNDCHVAPLSTNNETIITTISNNNVTTTRRVDVEVQATVNKFKIMINLPSTVFEQHQYGIFDIILLENLIMTRIRQKQIWQKLNI